MDTIQHYKTTIRNILATEYRRILSEVYGREFIDLASINKGTAGDVAREIVDKVIFNGKASELVDFLKDESIIEICPKFKNVAWDRLSVSSSRKRSADSHTSTDAPESNIPKKDDPYPLSSKPTRLCVIINNKNFKDGTQKDAEEYFLAMAE